jgi:hypothetical protein
VLQEESREASRLVEGEEGYDRISFIKRLTSLGDPDKTGVNVIALQAKKGDILAIVCQENL